MKILIEIDLKEFDTHPREVANTLNDALAEFCSNRGPDVEAYVNKRYPDTPGYAWINRVEKAEQVARRRAIAEHMRKEFTFPDYKD